AHAWTRRAQLTTSVAVYAQALHYQRQAHHCNDCLFDWLASFLFSACLPCQLPPTTGSLTDSGVCTPSPSLCASQATYFPFEQGKCRMAGEDAGRRLSHDLLRAYVRIIPEMKNREVEGRSLQWFPRFTCVYNVLGV